MGKWRAFAKFCEGKGCDGVEAVGEGSAKGNIFTGGGKEVGVVGKELAGEVLPAFGAGGIVLAEESVPPESIVVEGVGVVVVDCLVRSVAKPAVADGHGFECIEPLDDLWGVGFSAKAFLLQKGESEDAEEEVIVGMKFGSANGGEPSGDLLFFFFGEWIPKELAGDFESQHQSCHFNGVLVVILGWAPVFRGRGVGSEEQALAEPIGNRFTREGFGCSGGEGGGSSLEPVGGPEARAGEGFEAISLCTMTAGFSEDGQVGLARFHQFGERTKAFLGHAEPVEISPGRIRRCFGFFYHHFSFWQAERAS